MLPLLTIISLLPACEDTAHTQAVEDVASPLEVESTLESEHEPDEQEPEHTPKPVVPESEDDEEPADTETVVHTPEEGSAPSEPPADPDPTESDDGEDEGEVVEEPGEEVEEPVDTSNDTTEDETDDRTLAEMGADNQAAIAECYELHTEGQFPFNLCLLVQGNTFLNEAMDAGVMDRYGSNCRAKAWYDGFFGYLDTVCELDQEYLECIEAGTNRYTIALAAAAGEGTLHCD